MIRPIDANALIEDVNKGLFPQDMITTTAIYMACKWIENAPTIDTEPHWIPCSERTPEDGVYLVYAPEYRGGSSSSKEWHDDARFAICKNGKWNIEPVIAWMPLPKPYKVYKESEHAKTD